MGWAVGWVGGWYDAGSTGGALTFAVLAFAAIGTGYGLWTFAVSGKFANGAVLAFMPPLFDLPIAAYLGMLCLLVAGLLAVPPLVRSLLLLIPGQQAPLRLLLSRHFLLHLLLDRVGQMAGAEVHLVDVEAHLPHLDQERRLDVLLERAALVRDRAHARRRRCWRAAEA